MQKKLCRDSFHFRHFSFYFGVGLASFLCQFALSFCSFLRCSRFGCFLQLLLFQRLLRETEEISVCKSASLQNRAAYIFPKLSVKMLKSSLSFKNLAAANSTDLQFRLFAWCFYGNQLWDFFLLFFFLLLRCLLFLHLLLHSFPLCSSICLFCVVLCLFLLCFLFGCSSLKFTTWLLYSFRQIRL